MSQSCNAHASTVNDHPANMIHMLAKRYADLADTRLATTLSKEDQAEAAGLDPFERTTCYPHRRWLYQCVSSPLHVIVVSGHRWCRHCELPITVAVDELAGDLTLTCPGCGTHSPGPANQQLLRACRASLAAHLGQRHPMFRHTNRTPADV
jgi:hypothetical protein